MTCVAKVADVDEQTGHSREGLPVSEDWRTLSYQDLLTWPLDDRRYYVYRLWDWDDECLYVGSTNWLRKRAHGHRARAQWPLVLVGCVDICEFPSKAAMLAAEGYWYRRLSPPFNRMTPPVLRRPARQGEAVSVGTTMNDKSKQGLTF